MPILMQAPFALILLPNQLNPAVFIAPVQQQVNSTSQIQVNPVVGGSMSDLDALEKMIRERNANQQPK